MTDDRTDPLAALRDLPAHDVDPWRAEHIRLRARAALVRSGRSPLRARAAHLYRRVIEPSVVAIATATHLVWTFHAVMALYR
jgi:hypothetical protein